MKSGLSKLFKSLLNGESDSIVAKSPLKKYIILGAIGFSSFLIIIVVVVTVIFGPIMMAQQYIEDVKNEVSLFFEKVGNVITLNGWCADSDGSCQRKAEQKFYEKLNEIYNDYKDDGIEIDTQLITGTMFYGNTLSDDKFQGEDVDDKEENELVDGTDVHLGDIKTLAKNMVSGKRIDYGKYRKYLIDTYIPKRFSDMYTANDAEMSKEDIADEIMSFASLKVEVTDMAYNPIYASCSQVTINYHGNVEVHELEEYVAGVTTKENGGGGPEALKIQALLARSFAVKNCNRVIEASQNDQDYTPNASNAAIEAALATKGQILTFNGEIFDTISFASYPRANFRGFPGYEAQGYLCGDVTCSTESDGRLWCSTTIYKQPTMEKYTLKMPNTTKSGNYWNSLPLTNQTGHCYGISQVATMYYENELNYTYESMLKEFLSPGAEISSIYNFASGRIGSTYTSMVPMYETASAFYSNVNYNYYLSTSTMPDPQNFGECPWYAQGRAIEIVANSNMPEDRKQAVLALLKSSRVDGGKWYSTLQNSILSGSTDIYAAKPGSIITWASAGNYGHVGIIEDVEYDSNGRAARVLVTESWNGTGNPANASYSYSWQTIDSIRYYTGLRHGFVGYTYLLD